MPCLGLDLLLTLGKVPTRFSNALCTWNNTLCGLMLEMSPPIFSAKYGDIFTVRAFGLYYFSPGKGS